MRWAKVREKAKKYAPLIALLYFFFLLNGERHENHVLQSELAQLDHHLEMEFTSTKDFLAGNLSSPDYHDSHDLGGRTAADYCVLWILFPEFRVRAG